MRKMAVGWGGFDDVRLVTMVGGGCRLRRRRELRAVAILFLKEQARWIMDGKARRQSQHDAAIASFLGSELNWNRKNPGITFS